MNILMYMFLNFLDIYMYKICIRKFKIVIKMELDIKRFAIHIKLIIVMNSIPFLFKTRIPLTRKSTQWFRLAFTLYYYSNFEFQ